MVSQLSRILIRVTCLAILTACGGGYDGVVYLNNNDTGLGCGEKTAQKGFRGGTLTSKDGKATLTATTLLSPTDLSITIDCTRPPGQIGNGYEIDVSLSFPDLILTISYSGIDLSGIDVRDLQLGTYDRTNGWQAESDAIPDIINHTFSLGAPRSTRYAIYAGSASGGGNTVPPTKPSIQSITVTADSIVIAWSGSSDPDGGFISGYNISRRPPGFQIDTVPGSQLSYEDKGQNFPFETTPQSYCYTVVAIDDEGDRSDASDERCSSPFPP